MQTRNAASFTTGFSSQCFPVRSLGNYKKVDEGGAWLVAYQAEQRRRFKAVLSNEPVHRPPPLTLLKKNTPEPNPEKHRKLDGFYLMRQFYVEDPSDLCSVNVSGKELSKVSEDDFLLFDNVVHVDGGDNNLPFNAFRNFMSLRDLELPLNAISGNIRLEPHDFPYLEKLDLSYNRVTSEDILALGLLPRLKTLHLTGNEITKLPIEMTRTYRTLTGITLSGTIQSEDQKVRFGTLENLYLDNNELTDISTFSSLAGIRRLKYLNLENNEIASIPHLRLRGARVRRSEDQTAEKKRRESARLLEKTTDQHDQAEKENMDQMDAEAAEAEKEELMLDEVDEILSKKLPGEEKEDVIGGMRHRSSTVTEDASLLGDKFNPPMPFASLLHLNLANNMVFEEEGLLAVMEWPHIKELVIWGNPLTTAFKGEPPIISMHLGKQKGVRIFRQKPVKRTKPRVVHSTFAEHRKIDDALPPVPRKRDLLMLEGPIKPLPISYVGPHPRPLPPISAPPGAQRSSPSHTAASRQLSTAPSMMGHSSNDLKHGHDRAQSVPPVPQQRSPETDENKTTAETTSNVNTAESTRQHGQAHTKAQDEDEGFFLTQVDDAGINDVYPDTAIVPPVKRKSLKTKHERRDRPFSVETKYKGYEDLLDVDENDPDLVIPKGIQNSVRSLQYTLQHPLVFTESQGGYKTPDKKKVEAKTKISRQNKVEVMGHLLDKMRLENKTIESNLESVLREYHKDPKIRKRFPEAKELLDEVQAKYNEVRLKSMRPCVEFVQTSEVVRDDSDDVESLGSSFLPEERQVLDELAKFKEKLDRRI